MARDDWRARVELGEEEHAHGLLGRLGLGLSSEAARLAEELAEHRLVASREGGTVFLYADSRAQLDRAIVVLEAELEEGDLQPEHVTVEHWLADEGRWDDEPPEADGAPASGAEGAGAWEVRVECSTVEDAEALVERLDRDGYGAVRRFRFVIAGSASREEAEELARRLHGEVERAPSVWEVLPRNPFAVVGNIFPGGSGTPL